jgi:spermidine/putrescine transport system substrate-binding protein
VAVAGLFLTACQSASAPTATAEPSGAETAVIGRCGDPSKLHQELIVYNWTEYLDPDIRDQFEAECGVKVEEVYYDSNEVLLATLQAGAGGYDVIVPSDYMVQTLIGESLLQPLDFNVITNIKNYSAEFLHRYFDPEQLYTIPYFWGTTGFAVDTAVVPDPQPTWKMLFDPSPEVCGKIGMLDDQRETISVALIVLGYSINDTDPSHLEEAKQLLIDQSKCIKAYDSQTNDDLLVQGETAIAHMWVGDSILIGSEDSGGRDTIQYFIPEEGCVIFEDNLAIPVGAPHPYTAMVFLNYLADPEIAAQNAEYVGYGTPNEAARAYLAPETLANPALYPSQHLIQKMQWIEDVGPALELYDRIWTEFKAAVGGG